MSYPNPNLGDNYIFELETFNSESGVPLFADETPRYYIYRSTNMFPNYTLTGLFTQRVNAGCYMASGVLSAGNGFATGDYVSIHASGKMNGRVEIAKIDSFRIDHIPISVGDIYYANIKYVKDSASPNDEYSAQWYKNSQIVSSGSLTRPFISVYNTNTGSALISNQPMTYASQALGVVRYNGSNLITASGEPYQVIVSGTIDGSNRVWSNLIGLDSL